MDVCFPADPHSLPETHHVQAYSNFFHNLETFKVYMGCVRFATRVPLRSSNYCPERIRSVPSLGHGIEPFPQWAGQVPRG